MRTLGGKRALVTGAASGIGKAISRELARKGAEVLLVDVNASALGVTAEELRGEGARLGTYVVDLTDSSRILGLREQVHQDGGRLDVVVNNAGVVFGGAFLDVPLERHLTTYRLNTEALVAMTHAFLPDLIAGTDGHVVNIGSASGFIGLPFGATYASSKWAVIGFSESLALELALQDHRHVHVTCVCPSYVATGLFAGARPPRTTRFLTPERVAQLTVRAVLANRPFVRAPWLVRLTPAMKGLVPFRTFYRVAAWLDVNTSMMHWRGRKPES